jgi:hypothetical protein
MKILLLVLCSLLFSGCLVPGGIKAAGDYSQPILFTLCCTAFLYGYWLRNYHNPWGYFLLFAAAAMVFVA